MLNITNIPAPRVPVVEPETGLISREWYRFFYNIFLLSGSGTNQTSLEDLQVAPPSQDLTTLIAKVAEYLGPPYEDQSGDFSATLSTAQLASMMAQFQNVVGDIQGAYLQPPVQVGTMSYQNSDNVYITGGYISGATSNLTLGSVVFAGASGVLSQNNANLFWDNTNLRLGIGLATPSVLVHAAAASDAKFYVESTTSGAALFNLYAPNSGLAAYNAITSNYGATNSWYLGGDGNIDTIVFKTAGSERLRVTSVGNVYTASGATGMTNGFFYIPAAAGVPTGVPTAVAGRVPMYYDTTNNKFYVYNGAWKSVLLS
jgi:hypothetical protein